MSTWNDLSALVNNDPSYDFELIYNGAPFDYTNYTLKLYVKATRDTLDSTATVYTVGSGLAATNVKLGKVTWSPPHADLTTPGANWYHLDAIDGTGKDTTFFLGNFTIVAV